MGRATGFFGMILLLISLAASGASRAQETAAALIPRLSKPWTEAVRIVGDGMGWHSDFCLVEDQENRWHCIGIGGQDSSDKTLFHAVGRNLIQPFDYGDKISAGGGSSPDHMWAPFTVWENPHAALLYYAHLQAGERQTMRMLVSDGPNLETWHPYAGSSLLHGNVVMDEPAVRDPCIFWDDSLGSYIMYYAASTTCNVIRARTSSDLFHWSDPKTVAGTPDTYQAAESPFVLKRNGLYYLWISGFDYGRMSLYISEDPFNFGDAMANRIEEQSGHAPEIVSENGTDYMASAAIASKFGNAPAQHDLRGVFIQPIRWTPACPEDLVKIVRKEAGKSGF
jgi:hypothetical protein